MAFSFGDNNYGFQAGQNNGLIFPTVHLPPDPPETPPLPTAFIPFMRDTHFVERKSLLDQIQQACPAPPSRVAIVGLGGVGKSQLAIEHVYRMQDTFAQQGKDIWVFWVHASTRERFQQSFEEIADLVKIKGRHQRNTDISQLVYRWLCNQHHGQWLMILDSADDADIFFKESQNETREGAAEETFVGPKAKPLVKYLPSSTNGSIIITTRNRDVGIGLTDHHSNIVEVGPMNQAEALELLETKLGQHYDEVSGQELVEALGHLPLAINQAAAYIYQTTPLTSVKLYLQEMRRFEQKVQDEMPPASEGTYPKDFEHRERKQWHHLSQEIRNSRRDWDAPKSVIASFRISFEHIRSQNLSTVHTLSRMAYFDHQKIQRSLVHPLPPIVGSEPQRQRHPDALVRTLSKISYLDNQNVHCSSVHLLPSIIGSEAQDHPNNIFVSNDFYDQCFEKDIATLRRYSLISVHETDGTFNIHRLVQVSLRWWLNTFQTTGKGILEWSFDRLVPAFPFPSPSTVPVCREMLPHLPILVHFFGYQPEELKKSMARSYAFLTYKVGFLKLYNGDFLDAIRIFTATLKSELSFGSSGSAELSLSALASAHEAMGDFISAEHCLKAALSNMQELDEGSDNSETIKMRMELARIYGHQDHLDKANEAFIETIERAKISLGPEHKVTLKVMEAVRDSYIKQARWQEAESLHLDILRTIDNIQDLEDSENISRDIELAVIYTGQNNWEKAELLLTQLVQKVQNLPEPGLGPRDQNPTQVMHRIANVYASRGQYQKAESLLLDRLGRRAQRNGPYDEFTFLLMADLASYQKELKNWSGAEMLLLEALKRSHRVLGGTNRVTVELWSIEALFTLAEWRAEKFQVDKKRVQVVIANSASPLATENRSYRQFRSRIRRYRRRRYYKLYANNWATIRIRTDLPSLTDRLEVLSLDT
ncbi:hypothetical protein F4808DRAFT_475484 [Astrocystis sublimbata]|nr:hypothetical protein F4808DRAFT_475484 [Astrocystis sublimbata]